MKSKKLREEMLLEMENKELFEQAKGYAYEYAESVAERNVFPTDEAIAQLDIFVEEMPEMKGDAAEIVKQLHQYGSPATVSQIGGRYFGFINGGVLPVGLAVHWLADFWDQNAALYVMSPLVSKLEELSESWLRDLLGLPKDVVAGFVSGSSLAIFSSLAAARYRILQSHNWDINKKGLNGAPQIRIVAGRQAHSSVVKAIALLGFGTDCIEWVDTDDQGRIIASRIPELDADTILILQAGNVSSGAFDPFDAICDQANAAGAWVHIDGAFGLWAAASKKLQSLTRGMEKASSWSVDAHKTLNAPYDSGIVLCNDGDALAHALQASGSYIAYSENRDGMLYTPEMSKRARVIELWATLKYLGKEGVDALVSGLHERALQFAEQLAGEGFQIKNDVVFNQILVACDSDDITQQTMEYIEQSGECWVGGMVWDGKTVIRVSICSWATTEENISRSVRAFVAARRSAMQTVSEKSKSS